MRRSTSRILADGMQSSFGVTCRSIGLGGAHDMQDASNGQRLALNSTSCAARMSLLIASSLVTGNAI